MDDLAGTFEESILNIVHISVSLQSSSRALLGTSSLSEYILRVIRCQPLQQLRGYVLTCSQTAPGSTCNLGVLLRSLIGVLKYYSTFVLRPVSETVSCRQTFMAAYDSC